MLKRVQVEGSEFEAELGSGDSEAEGNDMGVQVTQDLSMALLGIWQEMAEQLELMWQMLQVAMAQLEVTRVRGVNLESQA